MALASRPTEMRRVKLGGDPAELSNLTREGWIIVEGLGEGLMPKGWGRDGLSATGRLTLARTAHYRSILASYHKAAQRLPALSSHGWR